MTFTALVLLAFAMSTDAFAAAIARGATMQRPTLLQALKIGALFGLVEGATPVVGWLIGSFASRWVENWDHWIAFSLLLVLGLRMVKGGLGKEPQQAAPESERQGLGGTALTAIATSIDAMAVGVGLAFVSVSITEAALLIGAATCLMVTIGVMVGSALSSVIGKRAEVAGGVVLIGVGATILYQHLSA